MAQLDRKVVGAAARAFNLPEAHVLAVAQVESNGQIFARVDGKDQPLIRFEGHIFHRLLSGAQREEAVAEGLASPKAGKVKNPASQEARWRLLAKACAINEKAALEATSWGLGQVMGMHWQRLGYASVNAMVDRAQQGLAGQLELMLAYVRAFGLEDELREGQWAPFARGYNGPGYKANAYDTKLAAAAALYGGSDQPANGLLRMGSKGARVRELQALLVRAGYVVKIDGDFGITTREQLRLFQKASNLTADGIYGPQTETALSAFRQAASDQPGKQKLLDISAVKKGGVAAVIAAASPEAISTAKTSLEGAAAQIVGAGVQSVAIDYLVSGLTVAAGLLGAAGVAYAVYGWVKSQKTTEA